MSVSTMHRSDTEPMFTRHRTSSIPMRSDTEPMFTRHKTSSTPMRSDTEPMLTRHRTGSTSMRSDTEPMFTRHRTSSTGRSKGQTSPCYRALGSKSPACENHSQTERDYSAARGLVHAVSQRNLDLALKEAQTAPTPRHSVCTSDMYVRPGSAASMLSQERTPRRTAAPHSASTQSLSPGQVSKPRYESTSDFGAGYRHKDGRPITADDLLPQKNRPVHLQGYKTPLLSWEPTLYENQINTQNKTTLFSKDQHKERKQNPKFNQVQELSKRRKLTVSFLRKELMREKTIVIPLMSVPPLLQVNGSITRLYDCPRQFKSAGGRRTREDPFDDIPLQSVRASGLGESGTGRPASKAQLRASTGTRQSFQGAGSAPTVNSTRQFSREPSMVSEYKLKMNSLTAGPGTSPVLAQKCSTTTTETAIQPENVPTESLPSQPSAAIPHEEVGSKDPEPSLARPLSSQSRCKPAAKKTTREEHSSTHRPEAGEPYRFGGCSLHSVKSPSNLPSPKPRSSSCSAPSARQGPSFIKGTKYGEHVQNKKLFSPERKDESDTPNRGLEGKTELLSKTPQSLTLSVFLPRENSSESSLCHRAQACLQPPEDAQALTSSDNKPSGHLNSFRPYHHEQNCEHETENPLGVCADPHPAFTQDPEGNTRRPSPSDRSLATVAQVANPQHRRRVLHCELFGPDLCRDCQVQLERDDVNTWQQTVHPDVGIDPRRLLTGPILRSCPSPASDYDDLDLGGTPYMSPARRLAPKI